MELRDSHDQYSTVTASAKILDDIFGNFSRLSWSQSGQHIAVASGTGMVYIFSDALQLVCKFSANPLHATAIARKEISVDFAQAMAGIAFIPTKSWVITLSFDGALRITEFGAQTRLISTVNIGAALSAVGAFEYSAHHNLVLVAGISLEGAHALRLWRLTDSDPYLVVVDTTSPFKALAPAPIHQLVISADSSR
jgi:hypothetical protein